MKGLEEDEESAMEEMSEETFESMLMSMSLDDSYYQMESGLIPEILWQSELLNSLCSRIRRRALGNGRRNMGSRRVYGRLAAEQLLTEGNGNQVTNL